MIMKKGLQDSVNIMKNREWFKTDASIQLAVVVFILVYALVIDWILC